MSKAHSFKSLVIRAIVWSTILGFVAYIIHFFGTEPSRLQQLALIAPGQLAGLLLLSLTCFFALAMQQLAMLRPYLHGMSSFESFQITLSNNLLNYLPLKAGIVAKGYYLRSAHGLSAVDYAVALTASQLLWIMIAALCGGGAVLALLMTGGLHAPGTVAVTGLLAAIALACYCALFRTRALYRRVPLSTVRRYLLAHAEGMLRWIRVPGLAAAYTLISIAALALFSLKLWLAFYVVGEQVSLPAAFFIQACVAAGFAVSFVPGNLGLKEGALVGLSVMLNVDAETATLAALIDRLASLLPTLALGPYFLQRLGRSVRIGS